MASNTFIAQASEPDESANPADQTFETPTQISDEPFDGSIHRDIIGNIASENVATAPSPAQAEAFDPLSKFDPKRYRKANARCDDDISLGRKRQTVIPVRKPSKRQFVRAHPSPGYRADAVPTIMDEATGYVYLLDPQLASALPPDLENKVDELNLVTAITADGSLFLWFYKSSTNSWSESARIAIQAAGESWVRVIPDKASNGYVLEDPMVQPPEPVWPKMTFQQILATAFGQHYIDSLDHPLMRKLRGDFGA